MWCNNYAPIKGAPPYGAIWSPVLSYLTNDYILPLLPRRLPLKQELITETNTVPVMPIKDYKPPLLLFHFGSTSGATVYALADSNSNRSSCSSSVSAARLARVKALLHIQTAPLVPFSFQQHAFHDRISCFRLQPILSLLFHF